MLNVLQNEYCLFIRKGTWVDVLVNGTTPQIFKGRFIIMETNHRYLIDWLID